MEQTTKQPTVNITYETLFEILKRERDLSDLQKLDDNFYQQVQDYLNTKQRVTEKQDAIFGNDERKKAEKQMDNALRLVKDIYDRREKKVLASAMMKGRMKTNIVDTAAMLATEKNLFDQVVTMLSSARESNLMPLVTGNTMPVSRPTPSTTAAVHPSISPSTPEPSPVEPTPAMESSAPATEEKPTESSSESALDAKTVTVRFLHPVPKFVGKELEEYGPFDEEDITNLPSDVAKILLDKERIELIEQK